MSFSHLALDSFEMTGPTSVSGSIPAPTYMDEQQIWGLNPVERSVRGNVVHVDSIQKFTPHLQAHELYLQSLHTVYQWFPPLLKTTHKNSSRDSHASLTRSPKSSA
jgi:hypothetical protein